MRQEHHSNAEVGVVVELMSQSRDDFSKKLVRNLSRDPSAIASAGVSIKSAAMHEAAERVKSDF